MAKEPRGLGKGLSALLGEASLSADQLRSPIGYVNKEVAASTKPSGPDVVLVPVEMVEPNPYQPRKTFDQESLDELTDSIRTLGLIQPITVRRISDKRYQIISGERRFKACSAAGMKTIPAYVRETNDQGMLEMAIVENIQRENLDPIETALSYQRLIDECKLTQETMAQRVSKKRSTITNMLRLLRLPVKIQHDLKVGIISVGHAKVLLGIEDEELQQKLCDKTVAEGLNVRQLEALVRKIQSGENLKNKKSKPSAELPDGYKSIGERIGAFFDGKVDIKRSNNGKGSITIKFTSDSQVEKFVNALNGISE